MSIWVLSDLHLCLGAPDKDMSFFGPLWKDYMAQIEKNWRSCVAPGDLVLIPGDISWAKTLEAALLDLHWIDRLPGTKLILKGNHDSWWPSSSKLEKALPPSLHFIHNNTFTWENVCIGGARLWDTPEYSFRSFITFQENPKARERSPLEDSEKIFIRELERLEVSLSLLDPKAQFKIAMTHYPPIGADLAPSRASALLEKFGVDLCVFGHLHSVTSKTLPFGTARGVRYLFTSADAIDFTPIKIELS